MGMVRVAVMSGFDNLVREMGADPGDILNSIGLPEDYFSSHTEDDLMPYFQGEELLHRAAQATNCAHFPALLGSRQTMDVVGVIAYLMKQCSTVGAALQALCDHHSVHIKNASSIELNVIGEQASLSYRSFTDTGLSNNSDEMAMAHGLIIIRGLCNERFKATRVNFRHRRPQDILPYLKIFSAPVHFEQYNTEILFSKHFLDTPILHADPALKQILQSHVMQLEADNPVDILESIKGIVRELLPTGSCSIDMVASHMAVHTRTLQRMLKEQGSSFSALLESVRKELATDRLSNSSIPIIQLSDYLGYADNTAFTRAFKRWYGTTPKQWRKNYHSKA